MHRRYAHHALFYGFMFCFAATCVATIYDHFLHLQAPYPFFSLPVMLGTIGGIGMTIGASGMLWIKLAADPAPAARRVLGADYGLLVLLLLSAVTGLLLLALRHTGAMATLLAVHIGIVLALFVMMPYCKFVHSVYRSGALLRYALRR
jgi:citrate/tricarballylate utilization protein